MNITDRIQFWQKRMAQTATPTTTTPTTTTLPPYQPVVLTQIPNWQTALFSNKPIIADDILGIFNLVGSTIYTMSQGKVNISNVWTEPSLSDGQYSGSLKNMYSIARWLYTTVSTPGSPYSVQALRQIGQKLNDMVGSMSFPEAAAAQFKVNITTAVQNLIAKIGI